MSAIWSHESVCSSKGRRHSSSESDSLASPSMSPNPCSSSSRSYSFLRTKIPEFKNNYLAKLWCGFQEGPFFRLVDWCITQLQARE